MRLDIRLPIGVLFAVIGVMLIVFGATSDAAIYARSLGHNVNLWWGMLLLVFGAAFTWFALRGMRTPEGTESKTGQG
jgi:hypothetical protein